MNDLSDLKRIEDDHVYNLINYDYVPAAEDRVHLEVRGGTSKDTMTSALAAGSGTQVQGIISVDFQAGNEVIFHWDSNLYKLADPPTSVKSSVTNAMHDFAYLEDRLIITNGTDTVLEKAYGSAPTTLAGSPPIGKYLHQWHNFVFTAGMSANKNRLSNCDLGNKDIWNTNNDRPYGEIVGIHSLKDQFFVFYLDGHIESLTGFATSDFQFALFASGVSCVSHFSIVSNGDTLFFAARDGFYAIGQLGATDKVVGGSSLIKLGSEKVDTIWGSLDLTRDLIHGVHDPEGHKIRWTVRETGESNNNREIFFDYDSHVLGFGTTTGRNISCYTLGRDANGVSQVKYGDSTQGLIYKLDDTNTDDGATIEGTIESKAYDFGRPDLPKKWNTVTVLARGRASETPVKLSYGVGEFPSYQAEKIFTTQPLPVYGTATYGIDKYQQDTFHNYPIAIRRMGESLQLKLENLTASKRIRIAGWTINAQVLNKKIKSEV